MKKRLAFQIRMVLFFLPIGLLTVLFPRKVRADVYLEPKVSFYRLHAEDENCAKEERSYVLNGPGGQVATYRGPHSDFQTGTFENGRTVFVLRVWTDEDGGRWGYIREGEKTEDHWFRLDFAYPVYDETEFLKDYPVKDESGSIPADWTEITLWAYPGGPMASCGDFESCFHKREYDKTFTDEDGRSWVRLLGLKEWDRPAWTCMEAHDVSEEELFPEGRPDRDRRVISEPMDPETLPADGPTMAGLFRTKAFWVTGAVLLVVLGSGCALLWMRKRT